MVRLIRLSLASLVSPCQMSHFYYITLAKNGRKKWVSWQQKALWTYLHMESIFAMIRFAYSALHYGIVLLSISMQPFTVCISYLMIVSHGWSSLSTISFRKFQLLLHLYIMDNRNIFYLSIGLFVPYGAVGVLVLRKCLDETTHDSMLPCQSGTFTACLEAKSH
jgi:hypothetical protein